MAKALAVRLAQMLYRRWEALPPPERSQLEPLARQVKDKALDLRGTVDDGASERELDRLREELREELDLLEQRRLAA
jgi:hypothetical protein